jgi:cellobiose-specific phosphotransferase system component IIA
MAETTRGNCPATTTSTEHADSARNQIMASGNAITSMYAALTVAKWDTQTTSDCRGKINKAEMEITTMISKTSKSSRKLIMMAQYKPS